MAIFDIFRRKKRSFFPDEGNYVSTPLLFPAEKNPTVSACVDKISKTLSSLPLQLYQSTKNGMQLAKGNPLFFALEDPSVEETPTLFNRTWIRILLLRGNAYLYVLPSDLEGMPLTLLEAMTYGCCCVTSDIGECADVIDGCGITFPRGNVEALREALQDLCDHPEKAEAYRGRAREMVSSKYTWQEITAQTDALYRNLLNG